MDKNTLENGVRILIADGQFLFREGLKQVLTEKFSIAEFGEASNGREALESVRRQSWDLVLMELSMPGGAELDVLKDIRRARPKLPVIILGIHPAGNAAIRVLKIGACAYIGKDCSEDQLVAAVEAACRGENYITPGLANELALRVRNDHAERPHEKLSDREYQVFAHISTGLTVKEVANALSISVKTVSTYRNRMLEKMGMKNNAQVMHYAANTEGVVSSLAKPAPTIAKVPRGEFTPVTGNVFSVPSILVSPMSARNAHRPVRHECIEVSAA